jgi:EamA-like transporter family
MADTARGDCAAAMLVALGTVGSKRWRIEMSAIAVTAWQVGIGCIPLLGASAILEHPHLLAMPWFGWAALTYTAVVSLGICYLVRGIAAGRGRDGGDRHAADIDCRHDGVGGRARGAAAVPARAVSITVLRVEFTRGRATRRVTAGRDGVKFPVARWEADTIHERQQHMAGGA